MDMLDILTLTGLMLVFDKVEDRGGGVAAWLLTTALAAILLGGVVAILFAVL